MLGRVEKYILEKIAVERAIHMTLIDPEKITPTQAAIVAENSESSGSTAIMIGGSTFSSKDHLDVVVQAIKEAVDLPTILFPNNETGVSKYSDAIWFMSLLNSVDPYYLVGAQVLGAPLIKKFNIEPLPMGYIIVGQGGTAGVVGKAKTIPYDKPELVAAHALAGQYFGMRFIYLEGGSGVANPVPANVISAVKKCLDIPLIVGGGIRTQEQAAVVTKAGADIIVTGNLIEAVDNKQRITEVIKGIKQKGSN
ncbi:MAG: geranylgeranylglyceryl/heptaprenylglyceryl phosphate synthase [Nitrososphaerota archaeon]|jgi:phosphoglycerol geranylgeranyltransferase|uniref:geranylgeranylglyceryl/heptaprenylglyceryl phosphate synthase n=1 Tax=Candidatus Bathycorpusculum sp. TaxID=2994959 RepID=UPI00281B1C24|nr:geranylgeranylglyceryl/heptaprenylglyceryl phosphate synthase [Candidatus Termiticorpusculum sp.]MCL2257219.1 geranylgeranylglyceryl/heptaprenylglyceryl phosphate synthase [Candidatus Termiticorpusculum sp.]MCL2292327.1 geranylgeranylglyceryl/heptaprenylglyceryl phosphate synthase [Candidatus Termiticorpusculum sp.]MDR0461275.1 geranylgeranylglyceryl/heptaprenylglyceryl phosphate synthase [Nitrososphaerota archaeon]